MIRERKEEEQERGRGRNEEWERRGEEKMRDAENERARNTLSLDSSKSSKTSIQSVFSTAPRAPVLEPFQEEYSNFHYFPPTEIPPTISPKFANKLPNTTKNLPKMSAKSPNVLKFL